MREGWTENDLGTIILQSSYNKLYKVKKTKKQNTFSGTNLNFIQHFLRFLFLQLIN